VKQLTFRHEKAPPERGQSCPLQKRDTYGGKCPTDMLSRASSLVYEGTELRGEAPGEFRAALIESAVVGHKEGLLPIAKVYGDQVLSGRSKGWVTPPP
jgi:hypothetical protein